MLFIDSSGANTARNNADLMVRRRRYPVLDLPLAAMALFAFQAHAPSGGAGNRTSMRGGGPLVTLVDPGAGLWSLVWANLPDGVPQATKMLPWMRATKVTDTGGKDPSATRARDFGRSIFGMPRRLRLVEAEGGIAAVIQRPYGTNYALWTHPLSPYYRQKPGTDLLPVHPRAGRFGYRHWLGILANERDGDLRQRAQVLKTWQARGGAASVIVAGWAMDNMKPRDFIHSVQPFVALEGAAERMLAGLIEAAEQAGLALRAALEPLLGDGATREAEREAFYADMKAAFQHRLAELVRGLSPEDIAAKWLADLRRVVMAQFQALALPGLDQPETDVIGRIVEAQRWLAGCFNGYGKYGAELFSSLEMTLPVRKQKVAA